MFPLKDKPSPNIFPVVNYLIILITIIVFILQFLAVDFESFILKWSLIPALVSFSDFSTLTPFITSVFLHGGFIHLISNMWFLFVFGDNVEASLGSVKYLLFYILSGVIAGLTQFLFLQGAFIPILGASGAIAGVTGYYLMKFPKHVVKTLIVFFGFITFVDLPSTVVLGLWFITQLLNGTASLVSTSSVFNGIAWWAHIGGFVFGVIIGIIKQDNTRVRKLDME
jgi:membrane associated rhomboid family serine protease